MTETSGLPPQAPPQQPPPQWGSPDPRTTTYPPPYGPPPRMQRWASRPFLRSRDDRLVAGVAGGVGRSLGIDPLLLRILFVVLAFFGGAGILLYALGWLLLDIDDGRGRSLVEDAFDARTVGRGRKLLTVAALAFIVFLTSIWVLSGRLVPVALIAVTLVALLLFARRDIAPPPYPAGTGPGWPTPPPGQPHPGQPNPSQPYTGQPYTGQPYTGQPYPGRPYSGQPYPGQPTGGPTYPSGQAAPWSGPIDSGARPLDADLPREDLATETTGAASMSNQPTVVLSGGTEPTATLETDQPSSGSHRYEPTAAYPPATSTSPAWATAQQSYASPTDAAPAYGQPLGFYDPPGAPPGPPTGFGDGRPPKPPRERRERSYLGLLTISVVLLALGVLATLDVAYAAVPGSAYVVLALGVVAAGLLVGTWVGRSRSLIVAGFLLSAALVPVVVVDAATEDDWSRIADWTSAETRRDVPTTPDQIQPTYDIGSGRLVLDLRGVDFSGAAVTTSVSVGAGEVLIFVPPDVDVSADASVDIGDLVLFGERSSGLDTQRSVTEPALFEPDGSSGALDITIDVNVGSAEVRR